MKEIFLMAILAITLLASPLALGATFSNQTCISNTTLRETNLYNFDITGNTSDNINFTQYKDTYCEYGCITTGNVSAECQPKPFDLTIWFIGAIVVVFVIILIAIGIAKR